MTRYFSQINRVGVVAAFRRKLHSKLSLGFAVVALSVASAAAQAIPQRSFPIRGGSQPFAITMGADGNFWFTLSNSNEIARITSRGQISYFVTPTLSNPAFITPGPDGNIWFGEGSTGKIASVTPAGVITEHQFSFFGVSVGITTGSDGNIWFTDQTDNAVWRHDLSTGVFTRFVLPTPNAFPGDIITGADGNIWIASAFTAIIARVTPTIDITLFPTPNQPFIIRPGNGNNLLFTEFSANKIASITTDGIVTESSEFVGSSPTGITAGVRQEVWFLGTSSNRVYKTV